VVFFFAMPDTQAPGAGRTAKKKSRAGQPGDSAGKLTSKACSGSVA
jgi:hypothetical protein